MPSSRDTLGIINRDHDRRHVAWDLETTGFGWNDIITVSGFWLPGAHAELVVNTSGDDIGTSRAESHLEEVSGASVSVTADYSVHGLKRPVHIDKRCTTKD